MKLSRRLFIIGLIPVMIFLALIITTNGQATSPSLENNLPQEAVNSWVAIAYPELEKPPSVTSPPEQDPCLHCLLIGNAVKPRPS